MSTNTDMQAVIDAARLGTGLVDLGVDGAHVVYLPSANQGQGRIANIEEHFRAPVRKRGNVTVFDAASFNQVLADNGDAGNIAIYFDRNPDKPAVVAVLNGNGKNGAGWGDFRANIEFRATPQWTKWKTRDGKMVSQVDFAEFLEDNLEDISDPAGATMLEIATELQVIRTVNFKSRVTLQSGAFTFQHDQSDDAKAGTVAIPQEFKLGIAPIFGLASYQVPARFRYRIQDGKLTLGYKLQRIESMMAQIVEDVVAKIERGANVSVMDGLPPA